MAGGYYLAPALAQLRDEFNAGNPGRDKRSDGWIGDASHSARKSDHNPDYDASGVVRAFDVDKDGTDLNRLLGIVVRDERVQYVIWNRRIYSRVRDFAPAVYTGSSPHTEHMHISLRHAKKYENDTKPWGYVANGQETPPPLPDKPKDTKVSSKYDKQYVTVLQTWLNTQGNYGLVVDGDLGPKTIAAVTDFQRKQGLAIDGDPGKQTADRLYTLVSAPVFPLPAGHYFGPKSGPKESVSGYFGWGAQLATWQAKMQTRGWKLSRDGRYTDETAKVVKQFQAEKGLDADGKIGPQTWAAAWNAPVS